MEPIQTPKEIYTQQIEKLSGLLRLFKMKRNYFGWLRLLVVLAILFFIYYLFLHSSVIIWSIVATGIALFLYLISADADNNEKIEDLQRLLKINNEELLLLKGDYYHREDGLSFLPADHPYAGDIDLFGRASIYQYINRCTSEQAKKLLADSLLFPCEKNTIVARQEAAKALAPHVEWRQKMQSSGLINPVTFAIEQKMLVWINMPNPMQQPFWKILPLFYTVIAFALLGAYLLSLVASSAFWLLIFGFFLFAKYTSAKVNKTYSALSRIESEVNTIYTQLKLIENVPASSSLLNAYKSSLAREGNGTESIKELKEILKRFDFRLNANVFVVLNTFLLWDVRQTNNLTKWKEKHAAFVLKWFEIVTHAELISTLATLSFNHPNWIFPAVDDNYFTLVASELGHPLINGSKRINNSFSTKGTGKVNVITGSNMAGKSTFLRSIAVNFVLAQAGAPVCAEEFIFSPVSLYSSMRIADNLAENTSTFYAELKKLKNIIEQVKQHNKVFILLDEILRGTNSLDRHTGSVAFIKQLIRENAIAVIATHDVELADLEKEYTNAVSNYHFDVQVDGEELYFDYKLKRGICQSMNASILMKKIGIEIEP